MKTISALPLLLCGLSACQTYAPAPYGPVGFPEPAPYIPAPIYPVAEANYRAIGTEPFWDLTIGRDLVFTDRGTNLVVSEPAPPVQRNAGRDRFVGRRLSVTIDRRPCSDGMSDRSYPDTVSVMVDGRAYRGCGANSAFFARVGENGTDRPGQGEHDLSNTNWRVASINGQPVPMSGYYFNFAPDRMSGKLGCNAISGSYSVTGSMLRAGPLAMTRMACPGNGFEAEGTRIMRQPMTLIESGDSLTLSNRIGTIELTRAR
jgi:heat shock protein HslJ